MTLIDSDAKSGMALHAVLTSWGFEVWFETPESAEFLAKEIDPDFFVIDLSEPKGDGTGALWRLFHHPDFREKRFVVYTRLDLEEVRVQLLPQKMLVLRKPVDVDELKRALGI